MPRAHHARLFVECKQHGDHVTHLISSDDEAWLLAKLFRRFLTLNNICCSIDLWLEGERGGFRHVDEDVRTLDNLDDLPF